MTLENDRAWAAGFFDGEGCVYTTTNGHWTEIRHPRLKINQKAQIVLGEYYSDVLERFRSIFPEGSIVGPYRDRGKTGAYLTYRVNKGEHIHSIMQRMWPYLGEVKKKQYRDALTKCGPREKHRLGDVGVWLG